LAANALLGIHDDLGDIIDTFKFDVALARSLAVASIMLCVVTLGGAVVGSHLVQGATSASIAVTAVMIASGLVGLWGIAVAFTRQRRRDDCFVVHRRGFAWRHDSAVITIRWSDITLVTYTGPNTGTRLGRWLGTDYLCRVDRNDGPAVYFDSYIVDASVLGQQITNRSAN
jgi:hypothetical protein